MATKGKILVTGGAGYIGSHTVVSLAQAGFEPVIIDSLVNSTAEVITRLEKVLGGKVAFYEVDCVDEKALSEVIKQVGSVAGAIHFAAYKAVGESVQKPLMYYHNNLGSLISLLRVMQANNIGNLVFSSSCTVYGLPDELPVTEQTACNTPTSPYGKTKQMCESVLFDQALAPGAVKTISLRYFNPVGAHESCIIGELPLGVPNNLVPFITQAVAGLRSELTVFGNDYETPDGTCIRDYIDITDLAEAHVKALDRLISGKGETYEVFNIGTGTGISVLELIQEFENATGQKVPYKVGPRRAGDIAAVYANATKAQEVLGWKAKRTVADSLASAWKWQQSLGG
ncbi:MAG: UDP-glucose 4-epimerase GalE [Sphingobacteriales bacterium]|nr:MAG: UDP-glucose 4-epimerase GalE [Sphingobacteriales bacterium]